MNYLQLKKKYPKTISKYFEWSSDEVDPSLRAFFGYLEFNEEIRLGDEYSSIFNISEPEYVEVLVEVLKTQETLRLNDEYEIEIDLGDEEGIDVMLNCIEILINQNML
jgi:hypothetical protein